MTKKFGFSKKERLTKDREFERVFKAKKSFANRNLIIYICRRDYPPTPPLRLGLVVSRKLGKAVKRNKVKRHLREIFRLHKHKLKPGWDLIFLPQVNAPNSTYPELEKSVLHLFERAGLLKLK